MKNKKLLFICGSLNQTTIMHRIANHLTNDYECWFTPYFADGFVEFVANRGLIDFTIVGNGKFRKQTLAYLKTNNLRVDYKGEKYINEYELIFTCQDLIIPKTIRNKKIILVQEGMTDPETLPYYLVKYLHFPRWSASTSTTGMSNLYSLFCIASEGYRDVFIKKGADRSKLIVTGIPNFDNVLEYLENDFPHRGYLLVATSDMRETLKYENRKKFIKRALQIADGKQIIFKLHPNENVKRATKEIKELAPNALIYTKGNINHLIANCNSLLTRYSSVVYIAKALGKKVYSDIPEEILDKLTPVQNNGTSAEQIANIGRSLVEEPDNNLKELYKKLTLKQVFVQ